MKLFSVEYIDPGSQRNASITMYADDKTDARDKFYDAHPDVEQIIKIRKANYDWKAASDYTYFRFYPLRIIQKAYAWDGRKDISAIRQVRED